MTVAELRALLADLPDDLPLVHLYDGFPSVPVVSRVTMAVSVHQTCNDTVAGKHLDSYPPPGYDGPTLDCLHIGDPNDAEMHAVHFTRVGPPEEDDTLD